MPFSRLFFSAAFSGVLFFTALSQTDTHYTKAYQILNAMLEGEEPLNFKKAVFTVENAFYSGGLDSAVFEDRIDYLRGLAENFKKANREGFLYYGDDREEVLNHAAIFKVMTDTLTMVMVSDTFFHLPFRYDFEDISGEQDWRKMFVSKLLNTHTGNCHSLPYLYKILAGEMGVETHLTLAPNHVYIKHRCEEMGMYNTELTSGSFPIDAWLMASGYVHVDAIRNRIYMEALNQKQSIALCMVDLAQGFQHKYGIGDGEFVMRCCESALEFYPNYINALLLKADALKVRWEGMAAWKDFAPNSKEAVGHKAEMETAFSEYEALVSKIHNLGYRRMPEEMYLNWLVSLRQEREKYENPKMKGAFDKK